MRVREQESGRFNKAPRLSGVLGLLLRVPQLLGEILRYVNTIFKMYFSWVWVLVHVMCEDLSTSIHLRRVFEVVAYEKQDPYVALQHN